MFFCAFLDPKRYSRLNLENHSSLVLAITMIILRPVVPRAWVELLALRNILFSLPISKMCVNRFKQNGRSENLTFQQDFSIAIYGNNDNFRQTNYPGKVGTSTLFAISLVSPALVIMPKLSSEQISCIYLANFFFMEMICISAQRLEMGPSARFSQSQMLRRYLVFFQKTNHFLVRVTIDGVVKQRLENFSCWTEFRVNLKLFWVILSNKNLKIFCLTLIRDLKWQIIVKNAWKNGLCSRVLLHL